MRRMAERRVCSRAVDDGVQPRDVFTGVEGQVIRVCEQVRPDVPRLDEYSAERCETARIPNTELVQEGHKRSSLRGQQLHLAGRLREVAHESVIACACAE